MSLVARIEAATEAVEGVMLRPVFGRIVEVRAQSLRGHLMGARLGAICEIPTPGGAPLRAQIVGVGREDVFLTPFGGTEGVMVGARIQTAAQSLSLSLPANLLGRVVDVFGLPMDDGDPFRGPFARVPVHRSAPDAMRRPAISDVFATGVRVIDSMATLGAGQRIGIFGPPGTGKTSLMGMLARRCEADVVVVGLVGERGREVREFAEEVLPAELRQRAVIVAATSDRPAVQRALCAFSATSIAEHFRDQGKRVFLLIDSLTRTARALREIGLAAGEAPVRRGYPASVYPALPALIERAGRGQSGDITAMYTVLTEGEIESDPIAAEVKSLTDGHIVLERALAERGHYPAIDIRASLSRSMSRIVSDGHADDARTVRGHLAKYAEVELLLQVGEYQEGMDEAADEAIARYGEIERYCRQKVDETSAFDESVAGLERLCR